MIAGNGITDKGGLENMDYDNAALLLRYEAHGPKGSEPVLRLLIMKSGNGVFYRTEQTARDEGGADHYLQVSGSAMEAVRQILSEERLYTLEKLETPGGNRGGFHVCDFYFSTEDRSAYYYGAQLEYAFGPKDFPKLNYLFDVMERLGRVLIPEGVPGECFAPAAKLMISPVSPVPGTVRSFTVFDSRWTPDPGIPGDPERDARLERYAFDKLSDGSFALTVREGWEGGREGAGSSFILPAEWFGGTFPDFLDKFTERYPASSYGIGRRELSETPGLAGFLGFKDDGGDGPV